VVDDSPFVRQVVRDVIAGAPDFEVIGEAGDGYAALGQVHALAPDLVTLDVEMPGLDGLATLGYVMSEAPRPVVMLSALGDGGATTMRALELGAVDFVRKPGAGEHLDLATLGDRLLAALRTAATSRYQSVPMLARARLAVGGGLPAAGARPESSGATHLVVVAASTGGPRALAEMVPGLSGTRAAVIVAQHMPAGFTDGLARRLDALGELPVGEARDGAPILSGHVYVAPGGQHTTVVGRGDSFRLAVHRGATVHGVAPAADLLFASAAAAFTSRCVAVVLTGMGHDGADGARAVRTRGGMVVVQDEATSVVHGMPHAALVAAGAVTVAPLGAVAEAVLRHLAAQGCESTHSLAQAT